MPRAESYVKRVPNKTRDQASVSIPYFSMETPVIAETSSKEVNPGWPGRMVGSTRNWQRLKLGVDGAIRFTGLNSTLGPVLIACSTLVIGKHFGASGTIICTLIIGLVAGLPPGTYTFFKYRRMWHAG
jgi:uncharacterized membrane protein